MPGQEARGAHRLKLLYAPVVVRVDAGWTAEGCSLLLGRQESRLVLAPKHEHDKQRHGASVAVVSSLEGVCPGCTTAYQRSTVQARTAQDDMMVVDTCQPAVIEEGGAHRSQEKMVGSLP